MASDELRETYNDRRIWKFPLTIADLRKRARGWLIDHAVIGDIAHMAEFAESVAREYAAGHEDKMRSLNAECAVLRADCIRLNRALKSYVNCRHGCIDCFCCAEARAALWPDSGAVRD